MATVQSHDCPYCFNTLDPYDDNIDYRVGVQCAECWTKYHKICWQRNGNRCMKCGSAKAYDVVLTPIPETVSVTATQPTIKTEPSIPAIDILPWRAIALIALGLLTLAMMCIVVLLVTR